MFSAILFLAVEGMDLNKGAEKGLIFTAVEAGEDMHCLFFSLY